MKTFTLPEWEALPNKSKAQENGRWYYLNAENIKTPALIVTKTLAGHTSPESAYLVEDYPYGYSLRCKIRYWLEFKESFGFRLMSQTTNPRAGHTWNKPRGSTYFFLAVMILDHQEHVTTNGLSFYEEDPGAVETFERVHQLALGAEETRRLGMIRRYQKGKVTA